MTEEAEPPSRFVNVLDKRMAYVESGQGCPIVFQHGNPTSSYLWRNVMPHVADLGRCIALDLIGMGGSDRLDDSGPGRYTFTEHRRPTLTWPRQIPLDGEPVDVVEVVQSYADWLSRTQVPKLFVNADPGAILIGAQREFCRTWPNLTEVTVAGSHFIQEDSPGDIGAALRHWILQNGLADRD